MIYIIDSIISLKLVLGSNLVVLIFYVLNFIYYKMRDLEGKVFLLNILLVKLKK